MIINNLTRENHLFHISKIFHDAKEIIIVSPYITSNKLLFPFENIEGLEKITFVITLKPFDRDQYSKIAYFKYLFMQLKLRNIELKILIENSLHGKIFIAKFDKENVKAIITSANFTSNGLRINNEWGILISDLKQISDVENGIIQKVKFKELREEQIDLCLKEIEANPRPKNDANPVKLNLSNLFEKIDNYHNITSESTFWLKPIGVTEDIIPKNRKFDEIDSDLHFSKRRPRGIKKGDILICYAVGHLNILSIYKVVSEVKATGILDDRWPFFVIGENLTPNYGREWSNYNINVTNQKNEVISSFNITPSGKNSYGNLMRGGDKLRLTPEFGNFLLNKITQLDEGLKKL